MSFRLRPVFLRSPTMFWAAPSTLSVLPLHSSLLSPAALPTVSLTEPCTSLAVPSILSVVPCAPALPERRATLIIAAPTTTTGLFILISSVRRCYLGLTPAHRRRRRG